MGGAAFVFSILAAVLFVVMVVFAQPIAVLMQAPEAALGQTVNYVRICGCGIFFIVAYNLLSAAFRGLGDSRSPLIFVLVACIVNIVGDLVLVAGFGLDAAGAALATVLAQAISVVCALVMLRRKDLSFTVRRADVRLNPQCRKFCPSGCRWLLQEFLTQFSFWHSVPSSIDWDWRHRPGTVLRAKSSIFPCSSPVRSMQSMASFVAQNVGAGNQRRAKQSMYTGLGIGLVIGCAVFALVFWKGDVLAGLFTKNAGGRGKTPLPI